MLGKHVFVLCVLMSSVSCYPEESPSPSELMDPKVCNKLSFRELWDLREVMGLWHTVEIVQHRDEARFRGTSTTDTCPMVHLAVITPFVLKMLWHEPAGYVEYRFQITDQTNPGFWMSYGPQNGSMLNKPYQQFAGTVQVMKAVQTHLVLTFCSPNQSHYSIVLARQQRLSLTDLRGVRNMLSRRGLPQIGLHETCRDSAALAAPTALLVALAALALLASDRRCQQ